MTDFILKAATRDVVGKKVKKLRESGFLPANLYGHESKNQNLSLDLINFKRIYREAGTSNLIDLVIDGKPAVKVLLKEPDLDAIKNDPYHIDIYRVKMTEKLTTEIPLNFVNESPAVVELEGSLVKNIDALEVECLPADLVSEFDVDLSMLKTFDDVIKVSDIKISDKIEVKSDLEEIVAQVMAPRSEEEMEALDEEVVEDVEAVEVTEQKPAEGEEGAEAEGEGEAKAEESKEKSE
jgi:large subunit ribosomal protein L25